MVGFNNFNNFYDDFICSIGAQNFNGFASTALNGVTEASYISFSPIERFV